MSMSISLVIALAIVNVGIPLLTEVSTTTSSVPIKAVYERYEYGCDTPPIVAAVGCVAVTDVVPAVIVSVVLLLQAATAVSSAIFAKSYALLTAFAVAASVIDVELVVLLSCTMPAADIDAVGSDGIVTL